jgi:flagellar motor switch protein FliM
MGVAVTMAVTTPFGTYDCPAVFPRGEWSSRLLPAPSAPAPVASPNRGLIESLVKGMRVDVTVDLGTAEVTLSELSKLRVGDLIVLSQKVSDPLPARVGGETKWSVWPGLVGTRHAVQVRSVATDAPAKGS